MKPGYQIGIVFIIIILLLFSLPSPDESLYKFSELGDIELRITDGHGVLTINEIGTFKVFIESDSGSNSLTIVTNATTRGFPCELQQYDFNEMPGVIVEIEWVEIGKMQEVVL